MKKLLVVGLVIVCLFITGCSLNTKTNIDNTSLTTEELYSKYNGEGFRYINLSTDDGVDNIVYDNDNISFTRVYSRGYVNTYPKGVTYYFKDSNINNEEVTLDGTGNKKQYEAYKKWLKEEGLNTEKVKELLDYVELNGWK